jgi:hypothetical protein
MEKVNKQVWRKCQVPFLETPFGRGAITKTSEEEEKAE